MPKKFATENTKAVAARERKKQAKGEIDEKKQKAIEDAYWKDDDKQLQKKQQRKEQEEKRKQDALLRKAENKALLDQETKEVSKKSAKAPVPKLSRAQISMKVEAAPKLEKESKVVEVELVDNINRLQIDGEEARNIDDALKILGAKDAADKHPEKRMKAAYSAYETVRLQELKVENPSLRLSQLKQMIFKEWQKSPNNPLNQ